ncbi:MAG: hypothetical protein IT371_11465 [Deltaproteobacteria bacterium]|nr:hypothetical protein [Deltaproteobacteria bacterium]
MVLLGLGVPRAASAWDFKIKGQEFNLGVTNTLAYTYHFDNDENGGEVDEDDKFHQFMNTLDVSLAHREFRLGGRFDLHLFANTPFTQRCPGGANDPSWCARRDRRYVNSFVPERVFLIVARPDFDLTLGDFYVSFGKGLALNVVKIDDLGQDTTIRGGKFVLHQWDLGLTFVAGEFNPLNLDEATGRKAPWAAEPMVGGRIEYRFFDRVLAGLHGVWVLTDDPNSPGAKKYTTDHDAIFGLSLEVPQLIDGRLSLAAEVDLQRTVRLGEVVRGPGAAGDFKGLAAYATATLQLGDLTLLSEFKYYDDFALRAPGAVDEPYALYYHQPPTLERVNALVSDNLSVSGTRLRADYNFGALGPVELITYLSMGFFQSWGIPGLHRVFDPYAGFELHWSEGKGHLNGIGGVRLEQDREDGSTYTRDIHLDVDLEQAIRGSHSVKLNALWQKRQRKGLFDAQNWNEMDLVLEYKWSPYLAAAFSYERQEDPSVVMEGHHYFGGTLKYFFTTSSFVSVRAGQNRPGLKCFNGMCRQYPAFAGLQAMVVGRF